VPADDVIELEELGEFDSIDVTETKERSPWVVVTSTSLAVFAALLT
jgi:hypothetical protein